MDTGLVILEGITLNVVVFGALTVFSIRRWLFGENRRDSAGDNGAGDDCVQYSGVTAVVGREEPSQIALADWTMRMAGA